MKRITMALAMTSNHFVFMLDGIPTIIFRVKGNTARGAILYKNLTTNPCFNVKQYGRYAHGDTLMKAYDALQEKLFNVMPLDERIELFAEAHKPEVINQKMDNFDQNHKLTGSFKAGREAFVKDKGIDINGSSTVAKFISLTRNAYHSEVIQMLEEVYKS